MDSIDFGGRGVGAISAHRYDLSRYTVDVIILDVLCVRKKQKEKSSLNISCRIARVRSNLSGLGDTMVQKSIQDFAIRIN